MEMLEKKAVAPEGESRALPRTGVEKPATSREELYKQRFATQVQRVMAPSGFIQQVDGYGVQVFVQATSFSVR